MKANYKFNFKAVALGCLLDMGGQFVVSIPITVVFAVMLRANVANSKELLHAMESSAAYLFTVLLFEVIFTLGGGFLSAHIAKEAPLKHAGAMAILVLLLSKVLGKLAASSGISSSAPAWVSLTSLLLVIPVALLGGYWRAATRKPADLPLPSRAPIPEP